MSYSKTIFLATFLLININIYSQPRSISENVEYKIEKNISYYSDSETDEYIKDRCKLDVYHPTNKSNFATIVWFHGGGLRSGNKFIPEELKNKEVVIVAVNYRLYPNVKSPKYVEDAAAAVAWVFKNIIKYGGDTTSVFVSGHSAGGYLTSMIGLDKKWLANFDINADKIAGLIPFSGHTITHFTVREESGIPGEKPIIDEMAPLFHVRKDSPPIILITGDRELELLGRYEENAYFMRMLKVVGHKDVQLYEIQGFDHGGMAVPAFSILLKQLNLIVEETSKL